MGAGIIPITHDNCWASETCKKYPHIKLDVALYQVFPTRYKLFVQVMRDKTSSDNFLKIEENVRKTIRNHNSVEGFKIIQKTDKNTIYDIEINDKGYSTIEGVHLYPLMIMPVFHKDGNGIEHLTAIFDNEDVYDKTAKILDKDNNITVLYEEPSFNSWAIESNEKWSAHKTMFTEFLMPSETSTMFLELLYNSGQLTKLNAKTNFLDYIFDSQIPKDLSE